MRSIRLSLLGYFFVLLVLALGAASLLAYRTGEQTLEEKKITTNQLVDAQYKELARQERVRFDEQLLTQAQRLADLVQYDRHRDPLRRLYYLGLLSSNLAPSGYVLAPLWMTDPTWIQYEWHRSVRPYYLLGMLGTNLAPSGYVLAPLWIAEATRGPVSLEMIGRPDNAAASLPTIRLKGDTGPDFIEEDPDQFFEIDSSLAQPYRSDSLGDLSLPFDQKNFAPDQALHWEYDDLELNPGYRVRRVILKTPATARVPFGFVWSRSWRGPPDSRVPPDGTRSARSSLYVQYAATLAPQTKALADLDARREEELRSLGSRMQADLEGLRNRLLLIGSFTLAAALVGMFWIVRHGLTPLSRLSEAVSRVSPQRLQLPFTEKRLPAELRPIVERLTQTLEQLRRAFQREKQATADISHELRTPLAALLTTTEIALRKPRTAEQYRELLEDCRASGQQMNHAVERLLTLARLDAGVDHLRPQTVDAALLAEQCAAVVRPLAEARNLTLTIHRNGAVPLTTDPDKLREVLTNLLHNAIQYNRPNGKIDLSVHLTGRFLELEVQDTGIGISPEARERIFERFYRADPSRGTDGLHAGLGLAIVKEYVDLLGGSIAVESAVNEGTTFRVSLPTAAQAA